MHKKFAVSWASILAVMFVFYGCESSVEEPILDEIAWVKLGWETLAARNSMDDIDMAQTYFGNALKIDPTYAPAFNGNGWALIYAHDMEGAIDEFQEGFLYAGGLPNTDAHKRMLYIGAMVALYSIDRYGNSINYGVVYNSMDANRTFVHPYDSTFTAFDALMYMALNHFALGNENGVEIYINELVDIIGGADWTFTTWDACAAKIAELADQDPS